MRRISFNDLIIFENIDYLAINKPPGISTLEDRKDNTHILSIAKDSYPDIQNCHRIDKDTSGVLVMAKNPEAYRHLSLQFQNREVHKIYHSIVHGQTEFSNKKIDIALSVKNQGTVKWDTKNGKESITYFSTIKNYKSFSLIECRPITGRRHQIRVHLKHVKHSILSDKIYDGNLVYLSQIKRKYRAGRKEEKPIIGRMALHAYSISFKLLDNSTIHIEAPYPKDFEILLKQLNKYAD